MKAKTKKLTKKPAKVIPGISRTTQITFIITAVVAYLLQAAMSIHHLLGMPNIIESFTRWLPVYLIDSLVMPPLLFIFAYLLLNTSTSKVSRLFKATLVPVVAIIVSTTFYMLFMELFRHQLGYGNVPAIWTGPWVQLVPVIVTLLSAVLIALYVFKPVKDKEFTASRKVQQVFVGLVALGFLLNVIVGISGMINSSNSGYVSSSEAFAAFAFSTLAVLVPMGILYLIASKAQTKLTRLFNAALYILILTFISSIVFAIMYSLKIYMHEPGSFGAVLMPILTFGLLAGVIIVQKMQKAF